jgi:hypothetical protein
VRGLLLSRFRRFAELLEESFTDCKPDVGKKVAEGLNAAIEDWHALGQLFSSEEEQVKNGLLAVRAQPFIEAEPWLRRLKERYRNKPELLPMVVDALQAVEGIQPKS